jgi:hypothetical protein
MNEKKLFSIILEACDPNAFEQQVRLVAGHFGGTTSTVHRGAWTTPAGGLEFETSAEHRVVTEIGAEQVEAFAAELGRTFEQHSVLVLEHQFVRPTFIVCKPETPAPAVDDKGNQS